MTVTEQSYIWILEMKLDTDVWEKKGVNLAETPI